MRVKINRLFTLLSALAVATTLSISSGVIAHATTATTATFPLGSTFQHWLGETTSSTTSARAVIWSTNTSTAEIKLGFSPDGATWNTSTVPVLANDIPANTEFGKGRAAVSLSPTSGVVVVSWIAKVGSNYALRSSTTRDGVSWSAVTTVDPGPYGGIGQVRLATSPTTGTFTAVWNPSANPQMVRTSTTVDDSGTTWLPPQTLPGADKDSSVPEIVIDNSGVMTVVWGNHIASGLEHLRASRSSNGVSWAPDVRITPNVAAFSHTPISVAVNTAGVVMVAQSRGYSCCTSPTRLEVTRYVSGWLPTLYPDDPGEMNGWKMTNPDIKASADGSFMLSHDMYMPASGVAVHNSKWSRSATLIENNYPFGLGQGTGPNAGVGTSTVVSSVASPTGTLFVSSNVNTVNGFVKEWVPGVGNNVALTVSGGTPKLLLSVNQYSSQLTIYQILGTEISVRTAFTTGATGTISAKATRLNAILGGSVSTSISALNLAGPVTYSVSPSLPAGLSLNSSTGVIDGTVTSLQPLTSYTVTGTPATGSAVTTSLAISVEFAGPQNMQASTESGQTSISFTPGDTPGATITNYKYSLDNGATWVTRSPASTASPVMITGLSNGTSYAIKVKAVTDAGDSAPSTAVSVTPATTASAPTLTSVTAGNASVSAVFAAGATGGSTISNYEFSVDDGLTWVARSPDSTTSPLVITGLTNGTTYKVKLRAVTAVGSGAASTALSVVPLTTPDAPSSISALPSSSTVTLTWVAPSLTGGASITGYSVQQSSTLGGPYSSVSAGTCLTAAPTSASLSCTVTGLTNGAAVFFKVAAKNSVGIGTFSSVFSATPQTTPGSPTLSSLTAGNGNISAAFTAGTAGGGTISGYEYSLDGGSTWLATSPATTTSPMLITGLANGTSYSVKVRAVNAAGGGTASTANLSATPITVALAPTSPAGSPEDQGTTLHWTAPANPAGAPITGYRVQVATNLTGVYLNVGAGTCASSAPTSTSTSCTITGLTNGTDYFFKVTALNAAGTGAYSVATPAVSPRTTPSAPTISRLSVSDRAITVDFSPGYDGGSDVISYEYSLDGGTSWRQTSPATTTSPMLITGLSNGTSYTVKIRAVNTAGGGAASAANLSANPITVPSSPTSFSVVYGDASATISFIEGDSGGSPILSLDYTLDGGTIWTTRVAATTSEPLVLTGLVNGHTYHVHLRESNAQGPGPQSVEVVLNVPLPRVEMAATHLAQGDSTIVEGSGFAPLSDIRMVMHSTPLELGIVRSDANGNFRTRIVVPSVAQTGNHHLVFSYVQTGNDADSVPFTVAAPPLSSEYLANTGTRSGTLEWSLATGFALLALGIALTQARRRTSRTGALSVSITVVWLYMQILRILAIARN